MACLPQEVNSSTSAVLAEIARQLAEAIQSDTMVPEVRADLLLGFGQWLKQMCTQGEPFRRHVALAFAGEQSDRLKLTAAKAAPLAAMLCKHTTLGLQAQKLWHDLWLSLIADAYFKKQVPMQ